MSKIVRGRGKCPNEFAVVGEGPGWQEDRAGRPFVGDTGDELRRHMNGRELPDADDVFLTNIYRFYGGKNYKWTPEDFERDEPLLLDELKRCQPKIIISLGRYATRYFLGDVDMDETSGIAWHLPAQDKFAFLGKGVVVFPIVHPAAGMHNPELSPHVNDGFRQLARFLDGQFEARHLYDDPYAGKEHYVEITEPKAIKLYAKLPVQIDSEGRRGKPWSMQYSQKPGEAFVVRARHRAALARFGSLLRQHCTRGSSITYHSALHDLGVMRDMGIETNDLPMDDTMVMSYLLQILPRGLKALCAREAGMKMNDYLDVLGDAGNRLALTYLTWLWDSEQMDFEQRQQDEFERINRTPLRDKQGHKKRLKDGSIRYRKITKLPNVPKTPLHKAVERCIGSKRPRGLWFDQLEDIVVSGERALGPMPEPSLDHVDVSTAIAYGARDADGTTRIRPRLLSRIDDLGLRDVYNLELSTYPLLDRMMQIGMRPDLAHMAGLSVRLQHEIDLVRERLVKATGWSDFNANSGDQVAAYLYDSLGLEPVGERKTDSGRFSTNDKVLEALEKEHPELPVVGDVRSYREFYKLKNTFVDVIPYLVKGWPYDERIHFLFRTTSVITGRLAATMPEGFRKFNILAQPKHGKFAKDYRQGFIPDPGHVLAEWDLSQIELRVLAHLSKDPVMCAIFRGERRNPDGSKIDLHAALAERIFGVKPKDQDNSKHRLPAKAVNFGLPMGMTNKGLTVELRKNGVDIDEDDAQRWIDETMGLYVGVPVYQRRMIAEAQRTGMVRCLSGRIRYIGGIRARKSRIREEAQRFAFSTPIQEGAQWVMKQNEAAMWNDVLPHFRSEHVYVEPLLQCHDALTTECENERVARELHPLMVECMTRTASLIVPIETSGDFGWNWAERKVDKKTGVVTNERGMRGF